MMHLHGHDADPHLPYWRLLDALSRHERCPICRIEENAERAYITTIADQRVNDTGIRAILRKSRGFCRRHTEMLVETGMALGVTILMGDQVELFLGDLERLQKPRRRVTGSGHRVGNGGCPACSQVRDIRRRFVAVFLRHLQDERIRTAWTEQAAPFCRLHFREVMTAARDDAADLILTTQRHKLEKLREELETFCRKQDYRFRDEPLGEERDAWQRAARLTAGAWPCDGA